MSHPLWRASHDVRFAIKRRSNAHQNLYAGIFARLRWRAALSRSAVKNLPHH